MQQPLISTPPTALPAGKPVQLSRSLALMKPVTWFGATWAFLCGTLASGATHWTIEDVGRIGLGMLLAGPILCGFSQVINDYFDREVDAINEPHRLIPAGLVSMQQVFATLGVLLLAGIGIGLYLGNLVALLVGVGILLALSSALLERNLKGGMAVVGGINLGGSIEPVYNAVSVVESAVDKGARTLLMPVSTRKQLIELPDEIATRVAIVFYADARDALLKALNE